MSTEERVRLLTEQADRTAHIAMALSILSIVLTLASLFLTVGVPAIERYRAK